MQKFTPWAVLAVILAALCAFSQMPASAQSAPPPAPTAQGRDNIFAVPGLNVDETSQQAGFASAQRLGFQRLARRLTVQDQWGQIPQPDAATLERMVLSVEVEQERRSATHYLGRLSVRFDPNQVRSFLRGPGLTVVEARTAPVLIVPAAAADVAPDIATAWRDVWATGGYGQELAPLAVAPDALTGAPDWAAAQPYARNEGAASADYATLRVQGANLSANVVEVSAAGPRTRTAVSAVAASADPIAVRAALQNLADQVNAQIQNEWKARAIFGQPTRSRVSASALYSSEAQWEQIKQALQGAASTLISEIRIEAVGRDGALVSFTYTGRPDQLGAELNRRGVSLEQSPQGPVLRVTPAGH